MPIFKNKADLILFMETLTNHFKHNLSNSGFELNLNIVPVYLENMNVIQAGFEACNRALQPIVQPVAAPVGTPKLNN